MCSWGITLSWLTKWSSRRCWYIQGCFFSVAVIFARIVVSKTSKTSSGRARKKAAISVWAFSATQWSGVVGHLFASLQARCSRHHALNFRRHILTLAALSSLSDSFGGVLSAMFTSFKLVWQPSVVESVRLNYHLQIPSLKEARPRDGACGYENSWHQVERQHTTPWWTRTDATLLCNPECSAHPNICSPGPSAHPNILTGSEATEAEAEAEEKETLLILLTPSDSFWFRRASDSASDSDFWFTLDRNVSYASDSDSAFDSVASVNQPLQKLLQTRQTSKNNKKLSKTGFGYDKALFGKLTN